MGWNKICHIVISKWIDRLLEFKVRVDCFFYQGQHLYLSIVFTSALICHCLCIQTMPLATQ